MLVFHDYLQRIPHQLSYVTYYRLFCTALGHAANPAASIETLDFARNALASRADMLMGRQRRRYNPSRAKEIETLQVMYQEVLKRMLDKGWR